MRSKLALEKKENVYKRALEHVFFDKAFCAYKSGDDEIAFAIAVLKERGLVDSGDAKRLGIGAMTDARWAHFYKQMSDAGVFPPGLDVKKAYTLQFVDQRVGLR